MRFGRTLRNASYEPWEDHYIDYTKLKSLLREHETGDGNKQSWTDEDEGRFVEELVNVQLEKVHNFHGDKYRELGERTAKCEAKLEEVSGHKDPDKGEGEESGAGDGKVSILNEVEKELDSISKEINELEKFSRINYTGFLKAAKKHDRKRGANYRVRPLLQVRLASLPFNSEDYSPLLYRLSAMYSYVQQNLNEKTDRSQSMPDSCNGDTYTSHRYFVHSENLLEVKTYILRRLPVLVYKPKPSKNVEANQRDPTMTSIYFDNPRFSLYSRKIEKAARASSLRLRWYGQLSEKPGILLEKKTVGEEDESEEIRFAIKAKYIMPFIKGEYKMEKSLQKLRDRQGEATEEVHALEKTVTEIQKFIQENRLQPVVRANYTRTAFQIPGDDRVRISIDTNLALIREDSLERESPCRDPEDWHRSDIDEREMDFPFSDLKKGEISRFPYAVLEIKIKNGTKKRATEWLSDLMSSHLVKEAPRFSKFVHGVAQLFEDHINTFPFWLSFLETDIRRDPEVAFQEEQDKRAQQIANEMAVGSFMGGRSASSFKAATVSPTGKSSHFLESRTRNGDPGLSVTTKRRRFEDEQAAEEGDSDDDGTKADTAWRSTTAGLRSLLPSFSISKYARAHRQDPIQLPPGVRQPEHWIKDVGPVRVEPKVWLANQRTFIKWMHISVLLATLSLSLYNGAGKHNVVAQTLGIAYTAIAFFMGAWGWWTYLVRSRMIEQRSGKDFDFVVGPVVACVALVAALCLNFVFKYRASHVDRTLLFGNEQTANLTSQVRYVKQQVLGTL